MFTGSHFFVTSSHFFVTSSHFFVTEPHWTSLNPNPPTIHPRVSHITCTFYTVLPTNQNTFYIGRVRLFESKYHLSFQLLGRRIHFNKNGTAHDTPCNFSQFALGYWLYTHTNQAIFRRSEHAPLGPNSQFVPWRTKLWSPRRKKIWRRSIWFFWFQKLGGRNFVRTRN
jgi:hypothetical protein